MSSILERLRRLESAARQEADRPEATHIIVHYGTTDWRPAEVDFERVDRAIAAEHLSPIAVWRGGELPSRKPDTAETVLARLRQQGADKAMRRHPTYQPESE